MTTDLTDLFKPGIRVLLPDGKEIRQFLLGREYIRYRPGIMATVALYLPQNMPHREGVVYLQADDNQGISPTSYRPTNELLAFCNNNPRVQFTILPGDILKKYIGPVYKGRRHRPLKESVKREVGIGDIVTIKDNGKVRGGMRSYKGYDFRCHGRSGRVYMSVPGVYYLLTDGSFGAPASAFCRGLDIIREPGYNSTMRFVVVTESDIDVNPPDAAAMYKSRRHRPLKESVDTKVKEGDVVIINDDLDTRMRMNCYTGYDLRCHGRNGRAFLVLDNGQTIYLLTDGTFGTPATGFNRKRDIIKTPGYDPSMMFIVTGSRDITLLPVPVYKSRRHRPINESFDSTSSRSFKVGDRVRINDDIRGIDCWVGYDPAVHGRTAAVVEIRSRTVHDGPTSYYLAVDGAGADPGRFALVKNTLRDYARTHPGVGFVIAYNTHLDPLPDPDAAKMYKARRHRPFNESVGWGWEPVRGDRVRISDEPRYSGKLNGFKDRDLRGVVGVVAHSYPTGGGPTNVYVAPDDPKMGVARYGDLSKSFDRGEYNGRYIIVDSRDLIPIPVYPSRRMGRWDKKEPDRT